MSVTDAVLSNAGAAHIYDLVAEHHIKVGELEPILGGPLSVS